MAAARPASIWETSDNFSSPKELNDVPRRRPLPFVNIQRLDDVAGGISVGEGDHFRLGRVLLTLLFPRFAEGVVGEFSPATEVWFACQDVNPTLRRLGQDQLQQGNVLGREVSVAVLDVLIRISADPFFNRSQRLFPCLASHQKALVLVFGDIYDVVESSLADNGVREFCREQQGLADR